MSMGVLLVTTDEAKVLQICGVVGRHSHNEINLAN